MLDRVVCFLGGWRGLALALAWLSAASPVSAELSLGYYWQSARGHLAVWWAARPAEQWIADTATDPALAERLRLAQRIRRFASEALSLPDNGSFTRYAQLDRPFVLWNVQAAPALSLEPRQWCFPVAGCVAYRGFFALAEAETFAASLRAEGLDVQVSGVPAYSTLGWFDDPLLSTFIRYPEPELAQLIIHELAHQVVYVQGDTAFNESFATAVELIGVERWLEHTGAAPAVREAWLARRERRERFVVLLTATSKSLRDVYGSSLSDEAKRAAKREAFAALRAQAQAERVRSPEFAAYDRWFAQELGNAHLMAVGLYHDWVPAFLALFREQGQDMPRFFEAARALGALAPQERRARMAQLSALR
jgi:predicted aminopeptidase